MVWDSVTRRFYGMDESASLLFSFDPHAGPYGEVKPLGQLCVPGMEDRRDIPYATLALALGRDRKLYYGAFPRRSSIMAAAPAPEFRTCFRTTSKPARRKTWAKCGCQDGRRVIGLNSADTGLDGTIYFVGAIEARQEPGHPLESGGTIGGVPYRLALVIYHPKRSGR